MRYANVPASLYASSQKMPFVMFIFIGDTQDNYLSEAKAWAEKVGWYSQKTSNLLGLGWKLSRQ